MTKIRITFPNGDIFEIPAELIATARTEYYAGVDGFKKDSPEWKEEFEHSMTPYELEDWLEGNMDWVDIKDHAIKIEITEKPNYDKLWFEGIKLEIE